MSTGSVAKETFFGSAKDPAAAHDWCVMYTHACFLPTQDHSWPQGPSSPPPPSEIQARGKAPHHAIRTTARTGIPVGRGDGCTRTGVWKPKGVTDAETGTVNQPLWAGNLQRGR